MKKRLALLTLAMVTLLACSCKDKNEAEENTVIPSDGVFAEQTENTEKITDTEKKPDTEPEQELTEQPEAVPEQEQDAVDTPEEYFDFCRAWISDGMRLSLMKNGDSFITFELTAVNSEGTDYIQLCDIVPVSEINGGRFNVSYKDSKGNFGVIETVLDAKGEEKLVLCTVTQVQKAEESPFSLEKGKKYSFSPDDGSTVLSLDGCIAIDRYLDVWSNKELSAQDGGVVLCISRNTGGYTFEYRGFSPYVTDGAFSARFFVDAGDVFEFGDVRYIRPTEPGTALTLRFSLADGEYEYRDAKKSSGTLSVGFGSGIVTLSSPYYTGKLVRNSNALDTVGAGEFTVISTDDLVCLDKYLGEWSWINEEDGIAARASVREDGGVYSVIITLRSSGVSETYEFIANETYCFAEGGDVYVARDLPLAGVTSESQEVQVAKQAPRIIFGEDNSLYADINAADGKSYRACFTRTQEDVFETPAPIPEEPDIPDVASSPVIAEDETTVIQALNSKL